MTHEPVIAYRCLMCGWIYDDDGARPNCPKCHSEQRRCIHTLCEDDVSEASPKERY